MDTPLAATQNLIGFHTIARRHESLYGFVARLVRSNLLSDREISELLPRSWTLRAFAPDDYEAPSPLADYRMYLPLDARHDEEHKLSIDSWLLFPSIANASKGRLRGCPACFELGLHSYAFQDNLLSKCPLHGLPLSDCCFHCATPLLWRHGSISDSAFKCPRGCDLMGAMHAGLDETVFDNLAKHLDRHLALINNLRSVVNFSSGPTHVIYPPRMSAADYGDTVRPSDGLVGAILTAIRPHVRNLPILEEHHDQGNGTWIVQAQPIKHCPTDETLGREATDMMEALRRGIFSTELPLANSIKKAFLERLGAHVRLVRDQDPLRVSVASFMLTDAEFNSLRRILSGSDQAARMHYDLAVRDVLKMGAARQVERLFSPQQWTALRIVETISGLIQTPKNLLWIRGQTRTSPSIANQGWAGVEVLPIIRAIWK